jgi:hypothetical protein
MQLMTIREYLEMIEFEVCYQTLSHRLTLLGVKPLHFKRVGKNLAGLFKLSDLQAAGNYKKRLPRKPQPIVLQTEILTFLSNPLTPVHRWYGYRNEELKWL